MNRTKYIPRATKTLIMNYALRQIIPFNNFTRRDHQYLKIINNENSTHMLKTKNANKHHQFLVVKLNADFLPWHYYVIRAQKRSVEKSHKKLKKRFPKCKVEFKINQHNAINLFNLVKEELEQRKKNIKTHTNYVRLLHNYSKKQFLSDIYKINDGKKA